MTITELITELQCLKCAVGDLPVCWQSSTGGAHPARLMLGEQEGRPYAAEIAPAYYPEDAGTHPRPDIDAPENAEQYFAHCSELEKWEQYVRLYQGDYHNPNLLLATDNHMHAMAASLAWYYGPMTIAADGHIYLNR